MNKNKVKTGQKKDKGFLEDHEIKINISKRVQGGWAETLVIQNRRCLHSKVGRRNTDMEKQKDPL